MSEVASCLAVPRFDVSPLTCACEDGLGGPPCRAPRCSLRALGQLFTFSFLPELGLLAASFTRGGGDMKCLEKAVLPRAGSLSVSWPAAIGSHSHNIKSRVRVWVSSAL